jgi:hypothetical protein
MVCFAAFRLAIGDDIDWTRDRVGKLYERVALATEQARSVTEHATALCAVRHPVSRHTAEGDAATERAGDVPAVLPRSAAGLAEDFTPET